MKHVTHLSLEGPESVTSIFANVEENGRMAFCKCFSSGL